MFSSAINYEQVAADELGGMGLGDEEDSIADIGRREPPHSYHWEEPILRISVGIVGRKQGRRVLAFECLDPLPTVTIASGSQTIPGSIRFAS